MMIAIYACCVLLLAMIVLFYYKFHQKNKEIDKELKDVKEALKKVTTELKDFQEFVMNGFQHISKELGLDKPPPDEPPVPDSNSEQNPMNVNTELSNDLKEKINNLNSETPQNELNDSHHVDEKKNEDDGHEDDGHEDDGHEDDGHEDDGHDDDGHEDDGHEDDGHEDDGHEDDGHEDDGHEDDGHEDDGHEDESSVLNNLDLNTLTLKELQIIARDNNLIVKGPKKDIITRIKNMNQ